MRQRRRIASGSPIGLPGFFFVGGGFAGAGGGGGSKPPPYGVLWGVRYSLIRPSVRTGASSLGGRLFGGVMPLGGYTASGPSGHLLLPGEGNTAVSNSGTDVPVRQSDAGKFGVEQYGELLHQAGLDWDTAGQLNGAALQVSSNSVANRSVAAPSLTTAQSGSMKAAGPQQRAVAADAEGYARRLQEVMPEFGVENASIGWSRDQTTRKYFYTTLNDSVAKHADGGKIELVKVSTDGNRNETPLTTVQIKNAVDYAVLL